MTGRNMDRSLYLMFTRRRRVRWSAVGRFGASGCTKCNAGSLRSWPGLAREDEIMMLVQIRGSRDS